MYLYLPSLGNVLALKPVHTLNPYRGHKGSEHKFSGLNFNVCPDSEVFRIGKKTSSFKNTPKDKIKFGL